MERLVVIIEHDDEHMMHMWQEADLVEADNLADGTWSVYGVTTARVCMCCEQVTESYVTALWGCVVESAGQEGCYELDDLAAITDDYLREVAAEVVAEAGQWPSATHCVAPC